MQVSKHSPPVSLRAVISPQLCIQLIGISKTSTVRVVFWYLFLLVLYLWFCINFDYMPLEITFGLSVWVCVCIILCLLQRWMRISSETDKQNSQAKTTTTAERLFFGLTYIRSIVFMKATTNNNNNKKLKRI